MADITDVTQALAALVASVVYPNGIDQPSVTGLPVRIYRGWPQSKALDADLSATILTGPQRGQPKVPISSITAFSIPNSGTNGTRYPPNTRVVLPGGPASINLEISPAVGVPDGQGGTVGQQTLTLSGTPAVRQQVGVLCSGKPYAYRVAEGDALGDIAAGLAAAGIPGATASGPVLTVLGAQGDLKAEAVTLATGFTRLRQMSAMVQLTFWCSDIPTRDLLVKLVDAAIAPLEFLSIPDDMPARLIYERSSEVDASEAANLYRRDLRFTVEYETTTAPRLLPHAMFGTSTISMPAKPSAPTLPPAAITTIATPLTITG